MTSKPENRLLTELEPRGVDEWGSGAYGASRGERKHVGVDFVAEPGVLIGSHRSGVVSKLGYPYGDDLSFRYVEVTTPNGKRLRFFYLAPHVAEGEKIEIGDTLGAVQSLQKRYPNITDHVHFEVRTPRGEPLNPERFL